MILLITKAFLAIRSYFPTVYPSRYGNVAPTQKKFGELKDQYRKLRDDFRNHPRSSEELEAWRSRDDDFDYCHLNSNQKSFIPPKLIGQGASGYNLWARSDTFFSEYAQHNARTFILSESEHSYIIGNVASYDRRQYPLPPYSKRPEGQGFCHSLVIPKSRIFNIVDPEATRDNCSLLKEMRTHFIDFWTHQGGASKILARTEQVVKKQNEKFGSENDGVRGEVLEYFTAMGKKFAELEVGDFVMGFHVFPENSIGHLHMHVFPHGKEFREYSTKTYDWKTVPLQAVLEVEKEEE